MGGARQAVARLIRFGIEVLRERGSGPRLVLRQNARGAPLNPECARLAGVSLIRDRQQTDPRRRVGWQNRRDLGKVGVRIVGEMRGARLSRS